MGKQHIKDITLIALKQINCIVCGQMFMYIVINVEVVTQTKHCITHITQKTFSKSNAGDCTPCCHHWSPLPLSSPWDLTGHFGMVAGLHP